MQNHAVATILLAIKDEETSARLNEERNKSRLNSSNRAELNQEYQKYVQSLAADPKR